jgi:hypothetical protein
MRDFKRSEFRDMVKSLARDRQVIEFRAGGSFEFWTRRLGFHRSDGFVYRRVTFTHRNPNKPPWIQTWQLPQRHFIEHPSVRPPIPKMIFESGLPEGVQSWQKPYEVGFVKIGESATSESYEKTDVFGNRQTFDVTFEDPLTIGEHAEPFLDAFYAANDYPGRRTVELASGTENQNWIIRRKMFSDRTFPEIATFFNRDYIDSRLLNGQWYVMPPAFFIIGSEGARPFFPFGTSRLNDAQEVEPDDLPFLTPSGSGITAGWIPACGHGYIAGAMTYQAIKTDVRSSHARATWKGSVGAISNSFGLSGQLESCEPLAPSATLEVNRDDIVNIVFRQPQSLPKFILAQSGSTGNPEADLMYFFNNNGVKPPCFN